jgi:hypothetical protein
MALFLVLGFAAAVAGDEIVRLVRHGGLTATGYGAAGVALVVLAVAWVAQSKLTQRK